eukprot:253537-Pleurochrysis_carterae.AAC.1
MFSAWLSRGPGPAIIAPRPPLRSAFTADPAVQTARRGQIHFRTSHAAKGQTESVAVVASQWRGNDGRRQVGREREEEGELTGR